MNDDFADALVIPCMEKVAELMRQPEGFDGAVVWSDGGDGALRIQLDDYWGVVDGAMLGDQAEHLIAQRLAVVAATRWVFATPLSYSINANGGLTTAHVDVFEPKTIWALCFDVSSGYDLCSLNYVERPDGTYSFAEDIEMLSGEHQMHETCPGFGVMRELLALT